MDAARYWILCPGLHNDVGDSRRWRSPIIGLVAGRCCLISRKIEQVIPTQRRLHNYFNLAAKWLSGTLSLFHLPCSRVARQWRPKMLRDISGPWPGLLF